MFNIYLSKLKKLLYMFGIVILISCGGGNSQQEIPIATNISLYGDSYSGSSWDISKLSDNRINLVNYAVGGCTTSNSRYGLPEGFVPYGNFQKQMDGGDSSNIIVIRFGVAEAVLVNNIAEFSNNMAWFVNQARDAGKQVILINMLKVPSTKFFEDNKLLPIFDEYNTAIETISRNSIVPLIDIRSQVIVTDSMMSVDGLHLTEQGSLIVDTIITQELLKYLNT